MVLVRLTINIKAVIQYLETLLIGFALSLKAEINIFHDRYKYTRNNIAFKSTKSNIKFDSENNQIILFESFLTKNKINSRQKIKKGGIR